MPKYTIEEEWNFDFPLEEIVNNQINHVGFPELRDLSDDEIDYLKGMSDINPIDFSGINPHYISEIRDDVYDFEGDDIITERICEHLVDWLDDYEGQK